MKFSICGMLISLAIALLPERDVIPEYLFLKLHDRHLSGSNLESVWSVEGRGYLNGKAFHVTFRSVFQGSTPLDLVIPDAAETIQLFGMEFKLPKSSEQAHFQSFLLKEIRHPWYSFERSETLRAFCMLITEDNAEECTAFHGKIVYRWESGKNRKDHAFPFRCIVAPDGQIFHDLSERKIRDGSPTRPYRLATEFSNTPDGLALTLCERLQYHKGIVQKTVPLSLPVPLPPCRPQLLTEIKRNLPAMKQTLQRMNGAAAGEFHLLKSPDELRNFAEKLKKLRIGMPPEEVLAEMGKPDRSFSADTWDPERKRQKETIFQYDFLRRKEKAESPDDLSIVLRFRREETDGKDRLITVR